ncbi:hypothetical protein [Kordiimonas marina]|uniref:hypothetical protein n=1 Tax=Kordiimonas marina TaxID=2872312 RepID=UPI001FF5642B|nr:hypothetical protein [Kordiimonas marina]MCJ9428199.1 hypothetical protein [Kordiimonas marina]
MPLYVNTVEITDDEVFREMQFHAAATREAARDEAARALLIRELLRQRAVEKGFLAEDATGEDFDAGIMDLLGAEVTTPEPSAEVCRRYYEQNVDRFAVGENSALPSPFEAVEGRIRQYLQTRSIRHGIQSYLLDLAHQARIAGFDLAASL